jgi:hypothetical protein
VVGDRPKHDDDAFSPQWGINFRIVGKRKLSSWWISIDKSARHFQVCPSCAVELMQRIGFTGAM